MKKSAELNEYLDILLEYNQKINLVSRKITRDELNQLLNETLLLNDYLSKNIPNVVDAGSGNGLLGIPIALLNEDKRIVLVEPKGKKATFLQYAKDQMGLDNVDVQNMSIEEYLKSKKKETRSLIARGFPELGVFCRYLNRRLIREAILITSDIKIKKNQLDLETVKKKTYNVPLRENLKILKMENSARDKQQKN